jgi:transposase
MKSYSLDLRERVAAAAAVPGVTLAHVAAQFSVSKSFVEKLRARQRATGSVAALPPGRGPAPRLNEAAHQYLITLVQAQPDATLAELRAGLLAAAYPAVSRSKICQLLQRLGWDRKKKHFTPLNVIRRG